MCNVYNVNSDKRGEHVTLTGFLPDIGSNELITGARQLSPSVTKLLEHSCVTSQLLSHHPHANSDPILAAIHSKHPLAKLKQSYSVTVCVCGGGGGTKIMYF